MRPRGGFVFGRVAACINAPLARNDINANARGIGARRAVRVSRCGSIVRARPARVRQSHSLLRLDGRWRRPLCLTDRIAVLRSEIGIATKIDDRSEVIRLRFAPVDHA